jgi:homopolymeric O-antigen transport system ATP-binding protein
MSDVAIRAEHLSKQYRIGRIQGRFRYRTIRETLVDAVKAPFKRTVKLLRGEAYGATGLEETIWALKDISFEVKEGDVVGLIGRNGAGKTTLLKILSRITEPTEGGVDLYGRVGSLLEVGTGFHPELTGRENIFLNGAILGMGRTEIERKFDEIVAFSEIEKFLDTPVKHYSSGMYVRLAFSVAAHLEPEILLVDEVLAVGDSAFQKKCLGKMDSVAREGRTVLFVSHNMAAVQRLCPNSLWIDAGRIRQAGLTSEVVADYLQATSEEADKAESVFDEDQEKEFQLRVGRAINSQGMATQQFHCDEPVILELICQVHRRVPGLYGYLAISREASAILVSDSFDLGPNPLDDLSPGMYQVRIPIPARSLGAGDYSVYVNFTSRSAAQGFNVDSPGIVCSFHLDDLTSQRGNRRGGHFSTLVPWEVQQLSWSPLP